MFGMTGWMRSTPLALATASWLALAGGAADAAPAAAAKPEPKADTSESGATGPFVKLAAGRLNSSGSAERSGEKMVKRR